uniref:Uncharacterized protein n=2 Tax=Amphimedon queenslandica TaxID=400682 RepID=A0A1X7UKD4_AMPQE
MRRLFEGGGNFFDYHGPRRRLFEGGSYSGAAFTRGNTVTTFKGEKDEMEDSPQRDGNSANLPQPPAPRGQGGTPTRGGGDAGKGGEVNDVGGGESGADQDNVYGGAVEPHRGRGRGRGVGQGRGDGRGENRGGGRGENRGGGRGENRGGGRGENGRRKRGRWKRRKQGR